MNDDYMSDQEKELMKIKMEARRNRDFYRALGFIGKEVTELLGIELKKDK